eukprot:gene6497-43_t
MPRTAYLGWANYYKDENNCLTFLQNYVREYPESVEDPLIFKKVAEEKLWVKEHHAADRYPAFHAAIQAYSGFEGVQLFTMEEVLCAIVRREYIQAAFMITRMQVYTTRITH